MLHIHRGAVLALTSDAVGLLAVLALRVGRSLSTVANGLADLALERAR